MSNTKHTPGPWEVGKIYTNRYKEHLPIMTREKQTIASTIPVKILATDEDKANAKLIAVAPEMFESLTGKEEDPHLYAVNWLATLLRICRKEFVYNAIVEDQGGDFDSVNTMLMELETLVKTGNEAIKKAT